MYRHCLPQYRHHTGNAESRTGIRPRRQRADQPPGLTLAASMDVEPSFSSDTSTVYTHNQDLPSDFSPTQRQDSRSLYRTSSLDRGRDNYYSVWTGKSFEPSPAISTETDPENTTSLWKIVSMGDRHMTLRPRDKVSESSESAIPRPSVTPSTAVTASSTLSKPNSKYKRPSPYDTKFYEQVLQPRGIQLETGGTSWEAHNHFDVQAPTGNRSEHYNGVRGAKDSSIWLEVEHNFLDKVTKNYERMQRRQMCEAEYATYAKETLLKQDAVIVDRVHEKVWRTERMVELVAKPDDTNSKWLPPPIVERDSSASSNPLALYEFDLCPDCSYWLSVLGFNRDHASLIRDWTFVIQKEITCPYFTVEFKKDDQNTNAAQNQVAAAASVTLYNRYCLRRNSLRLEGREWTKKMTECLRHYGLTLKGSEYIVWLITPCLSGYEWAGVQMSRMREGDCTLSFDVRDLIDWINEIHCWGLTVHGM